MPDERSSSSAHNAKPAAQHQQVFGHPNARVVEHAIGDQSVGESQPSSKQAQQAQAKFRTFGHSRAQQIRIDGQDHSRADSQCGHRLWFRIKKVPLAERIARTEETDQTIPAGTTPRQFHLAAHDDEQAILAAGFGGYVAAWCDVKRRGCGADRTDGLVTGRVQCGRTAKQRVCNSRGRRHH